jgi:hypothetical protein
MKTIAQILKSQYPSIYYVKTPYRGPLEGLLEGFLVQVLTYEDHLRNSLFTGRPELLRGTPRKLFMYAVENELFV